MGKRPKRKELLEYPYLVLDEAWPRIMSKLGLEDDFMPMPYIEISRRDSEYTGEEFLRISYTNIIKSFYGKTFKTQGLDINYSELLKGDVVHECVHYVHNDFFEGYPGGYEFYIEGLASVVSVDVHIEDGEFDMAAVLIADYFKVAKKKYNGCFYLPERHRRHIDDIIADGSYIPPESYLPYGKGFVHICMNYLRQKGYNWLLNNPFKNSEAG